MLVSFTPRTMFLRPNYFKYTTMKKYKNLFKILASDNFILLLCNLQKLFLKFLNFLWKLKMTVCFAYLRFCKNRKVLIILLNLQQISKYLCTLTSNLRPKLINQVNCLIKKEAITEIPNYT